MSKDTMSFPRGGSLRLTHDKSSDTSGNLFSSVSSSGGKRKKRKSKADNVKTSFDNLVTGLKKKTKKNQQSLEDLDEERPKSAFKLIGSKLHPDVRCLGIVVKVSKLSAAVSLPSGLTGIVRLCDMSDQHAAKHPDVVEDMGKYLKIGQTVKCAFVERIKKTNYFSLAASRVNTKQAIRGLAENGVVYGTVQSVEDHGYQVSFGHGTHAFLSFKITGGDFDNPTLKVGEGVNAVVTEAQRIVQLDNSADKVANCTTTRVKKFEGLQPGMLVKCRVQDYLHNGVFVSFLGYYNGTCDLFHMERWDLDPEMRKLHQKDKGKILDGRVLFVDKQTKQIGLSFAPHIVQRTSQNETQDMEIMSKSIQSVFKDCTVKRIDKRQGVLLQTDGGIWAYARRRRMESEMEEEDEVVQLDKKFKVGECATCKVVSHSPIDGVMVVSLSKSVIEASVLSINDVKPGLLVRAKVFAVQDNGVKVVLSENIMGFIDVRQLSDAFISEPAKRFKVGQVLNCKVLSVSLLDVMKPKIFLTNKKSLTHSELPMISDYKDAKPGLVSDGYISGVKKGVGVFVTFYNSVCGLVSADELASLGIKDIEVYKVGKPVKVRVLSCYGPKRMLLTFRIATSSTDPADASTDEQIPIGSFVKGKVIKKMGQDLIVQLSKTKKNVYLPRCHLSDDPARAELLFKKCYKVGNMVSNALVIDRNQAGDTIVTIKPSLMLSHKEGSLPMTIEDILVRSYHVGYVKWVTNKCAFVSFLGGLGGVVPRANICDEFVQDAQAQIQVGQTAIVSVLDVNAENQRVLLSMKPSVVDLVNDTTMDAYLSLALEATLQEERMIYHKAFEGQEFKLGDIVEGTVENALPDGVELTLLGSSGKAFIPKKNGHLREGLRVGDKVSCVVIDVRCKRNTIYCSTKASLLSKKGQRPIKDDEVAIVELEAETYCVVSIRGQLAMAPMHCMNSRLYSHNLDKPRYPVRRLHGFVKILTAQSSTKKRKRRRSGSMDVSSLPEVKAEIGNEVVGRIFDISSSVISVELNLKEMDEDKKSRGQIHISDILCTSEDVERLVGENESVMAQFNVGDSVEAVIVNLQSKTDKKDQKILNVWLKCTPSASKKKKKKKRKSQGASDVLPSPPTRLQDMKVDQEYVAYVESVRNDHILVCLSRTVRGSIYCTQVSSDVELLDRVFNKKDEAITIGSLVKVKVLQVSPEIGRLHLTML